MVVLVVGDLQGQRLAVTVAHDEMEHAQARVDGGELRERDDDRRVRARCVEIVSDADGDARGRRT
jgi:hypothetical protein